MISRVLVLEYYVLYVLLLKYVLLEYSVRVHTSTCFLELLLDASSIVA
jgi:hypothetical protein